MIWMALIFAFMALTTARTLRRIADDITFTEAAGLEPSWSQTAEFMLGLLVLGLSVGGLMVSLITILGGAP